jgi:hypothetical protein
VTFKLDHGEIFLDNLRNRSYTTLYMTICLSINVQRGAKGIKHKGKHVNYSLLTKYLYLFVVLSVQSVFYIGMLSKSSRNIFNISDRQ